MHGRRSYRNEGVSQLKPVVLNALLFALAACMSLTAHAAKKVPLTDAHYSGSVSVGSKASVSVTATTFEPNPQTSSTLAYAGGIYVPVAWKVKDNFFFTPADQRVLADILRDELVRLAIFEGSSGAADGTVTIGLDFREGTYEHMSNEYSLTLGMTVIDSSNRKFGRTYMVNSNEKSTGWKKLNTSVWQGKMQLAQNTIDKLIPDIQDFLRRTQPAEALKNEGIMTQAECPSRIEALQATTSAAWTEAEPAQKMAREHREPVDAKTAAEAAMQKAAGVAADSAQAAADLGLGSCGGKL